MTTVTSKEQGYDISTNEIESELAVVTFTKDSLQL